MTPYDIVTEARAWLGTRWQHQASLKGVATDCIGLVAGVARELGIDGAAAWEADQRRRSYGRSPDPGMLLEAADEYLHRVPIEQVGVGDVLVMRMRNVDHPRHFAIVSSLDPMYIVHAYAAVRKVVENRVDEVWRSRIVRAYRFRT